MIKQKYQVTIQHDLPVDEMIHLGLNDLGGLNSIIPSGRRIIIKPNLVIAKTNDTGATTSPQVIEALIREVLKTSPAEIALGESSTAGDDTMKAFQVTGMDKIAQKYGIKVIDFKRGPHIVKEVPEGREIKSVKISQYLLNYNYFINVPVLKIHGETTVTIGMKNLKGCIHDKEKHRFHRLNLHQCIVDLNTLVKPDLTVVDATTCSLQWELGGDPVKLNTILIGKNVLAVDIIASSLLGYSIEEVPYLKIASESKQGPTGFKEIEVFNYFNKDEKRKIKEIVHQKGTEYNLKDLKIIEKGTCSSCKGALVAAMRRLSREGYSPTCAVAMGQLLSEENEKLAQARNNGIPVIGIGNCGSKVVQGYSAKNIKSCPARAEQVYGILKEFDSSSKS